MATMNIEFLRVEHSKADSPRFETAIRQMAGLPGDHRGRWLDFGRYHVRLHQVKDHPPGLIAGEIQAIRTKSAARKGDLAGHVELIQMAMDEGLVDDAAFVYSVPLSVLVMERNHVGPSLTAFSNLLLKRGNCRGIDYLPILQGDAQARLDRMQVIKRITVKIAKPKKGTYLKETDSTLDAILDAANEANGPTVDISISAGRRPAKGQWGLWLGRLIPAFRRNDAKTLKVEGLVDGEDGERIDSVDLVTDRIKERVEVEQDEARSTSWQRRIEALIGVLDRRMPEFEAQFGEGS